MTIQELADTYINGNLSIVKNECLKDPKKIAEVARELNETEKENFLKLVCMW